MFDALTNFIKYLITFILNNHRFKKAMYLRKIYWKVMLYFQQILNKTKYSLPNKLVIYILYHIWISKNRLVKTHVRTWIFFGDFTIIMKKYWDYECLHALKTNKNETLIQLKYFVLSFYIFIRCFHRVTFQIWFMVVSSCLMVLYKPIKWVQNFYLIWKHEILGLFYCTGLKANDKTFTINKTVNKLF